MAFRIAAFADEAASSLEEQIAALRGNGIDLLEIRGVDGENIADISHEKARRIRSRLDDAGVAVWSIGSPFGKISMTDPFEPHLDGFKRCLETAHLLGCGHFRLFSFYGAERLDAVCERLARFIDAARGSGIVLCHENEKGIYGDTAAKCLEIHRALPSLKAVFDPANFIQCGQETKAAWELLAPHVAYMHIKDALPDGSVVPAGRGAGELPWLLARYRGDVLTVEPHLGVFEGFDKLEAGRRAERAYVYPDALTAFSAAVSALRDIIGR